MPVLLTIFGLKTTSRTIHIGMAAGIIVTAVLLIFYKNVDAFFPGIFANLIGLLGSHYLLGGRSGWVQKQHSIGVDKDPNIEL